MVGFLCGRMMRLLKHTSIHNRPRSLAAAVALGLLVGILPKTNLLCVLVALLVVLLPLHNLLAIVVGAAISLLMARVAFATDQLTGSVGLWMLELAPLHAMWLALDALPIVPWLCLHNSVVLGSFVLGILCFAPTYLVALRWFEQLEYASPSAQPKIAIQPQHNSQSPTAYTIPGHHLNHRTATIAKTEIRAATENAHASPSQKEDGYRKNSGPVKADDESVDRKHEEDSSAEYEPAREVAPIINAWHMGRPLLVTAQVNGASDPYPLRMHHAISSYVSASGSNATAQANETIAESRSAASQSPVPTPKSIPALRSELDSMTIRDQSIDSLELAQNATEVLAWVDDLLDECLVDPQPPRYREPDTPTSPEIEQWVIETNIEIVRLGEESIPDTTPQSSLDTEHQAIKPLSANRPSQASGRSDATAMAAKKTLESTQTMFATQTQQDWQAAAAGLSQLEALLAVEQSLDLENGQTTADASGHMTARGSESSTDGAPSAMFFNMSQRRDSEDRKPTTGFQQLVMADIKSTAQPRSTESIEPVRGESLAYLLGHLRQIREGKSV